MPNEYNGVYTNEGKKWLARILNPDFMETQYEDSLLNYLSEREETISRQSQLGRYSLAKKITTELGEIRRALGNKNHHNFEQSNNQVN